MRLPRLVLGVATAALVAVGAAACGSTAAPTTTTTTLPPLPPQVYAYVTMIGPGSGIGLGHTVVPVNVSVGGTGAGTPIAVGTYPDAIAITPDGTRAYVTNYTSNSVTPVDLLTGKALPPIALGANAGPAGIAITPNGTTAYVTDAGATGTLGDTITPIDLATGKTLAPITVGPGPEGIAITPNGDRAYVGDAGAFVAGQTGAIGSTVTPVDLTTGKALAPIPVGNAPAAVAITPDGTTALVANVNSGSVSPIDVATDKAGSPISLQGGPVSIAFLGFRAHDRLGRRRGLDSVENGQRDTGRPHERHRRGADRRREEPPVHRHQPRRHGLGRLLRQPDARPRQHQDAEAGYSHPPSRRTLRRRRDLPVRLEHHPNHGSGKSQGLEEQDLGAIRSRPGPVSGASGPSRRCC